MKKYVSNFKPAILFLCLFVLFTLLVLIVDVGETGTNETRLGFSGLNHALTPGYSGFFYVLSEIFGVLALILAGFFAVTGVIQLIKRRSLLKVDHRILVLGAVYVLMLILYLAFDHIPINYRPVLNGDELEISYPSSHTMLALTVFLTAVVYIGRALKDRDLRKKITIVLLVLAGLAVLTRYLSGIHWFTDIIGAILLAMFLMYFYRGGIKTVSQIKKAAKREPSAEVTENE